MQLTKSFSTKKYQSVYLVEESQHQMRLDQFVQMHITSMSRQEVKKKIAKNEILIDGRHQKLKPSTKVALGDKVQITTYNNFEEAINWDGQAIELEEPTLLFEDKDYIVINKPPYMATHPTGKHLFFCATVYFEEILKTKLHSVHRLDTETSGVLVMAKNPKMAGRLIDFFEAKKIQKAYLLIAKRPDTLAFPFSAKERLGQLSDYVPAMYMHCFSPGSSQGKESHTDFDLICVDKNYICALAYPKTGRQHQIRAHAAHHGFSLIGDKLYNGDPSIFTRFKDGIEQKDDFDKLDLHRHALHACAIKLPIEEPSRIHLAPLPKDLKDWLNKRTNFQLREIENILADKIKNYFLSN